MAERDVRRGGVGAVIALSALLGALISIYKYFSEASGIAQTPGALLVIITSVLIAILGWMLSRPAAKSTALRRFLLAVSLILIVGTCFAAYLLESYALALLMLVCFFGWIGLLVRPTTVAPA